MVQNGSPTCLANTWPTRMPSVDLPTPHVPVTYSTLAGCFLSRRSTSAVRSSSPTPSRNSGSTDLSVVRLLGLVRLEPHSRGIDTRRGEYPYANPHAHDPRVAARVLVAN